MNQKDPDDPIQEQSSGFPIIGIGASAGGLEALRGLFLSIPAGTGAGYVLVQHLDPTHDSLMAELLTKYAHIPVVQIQDGMQVEPNRLHVIPPNAEMTVSQGILHLGKPTQRRGLRMPIDRFFSSLADDQQDRAIAIVLSGAGTDGTYGVRLVKARGGMVLAQDPTTAGYDGMPRSAVSTGDVDYVLPVSEMPEVLIRYIEHWRMHGGMAATDKNDQDYLDNILALLIARQNSDFRCYKRGTINRRILRRMGLRHIASLQEYHAQLRDDQAEVRALAKDLLIGVTGFFREPEAWNLLRDQVLKRLCARQGKDEVIRVWVPGCATGEEAYSLAMVLIEASEAVGRSNNIIVFATDVDREALEVARSGIYAESLVAEIDVDRLQRFFIRQGDSYQVKKGLREKVIFAPQNLISDPPFSNLALISCRNLLIYIETDYQERLLSLFHFSLRDGGYLFLGSSETVGQGSQLFEAVSKKWRIYRRLDDMATPSFEIPGSAQRRHGPPTLGSPPPRMPKRGGYGSVAQKALIEQFAPAAVLVDREYHVLYYHGPVRDYLGPAPGDPSDDLLVLATEGVRGKLRSALHLAASEGKKIELGGAHVRRGEQWYTVRVSVYPVRHTDAGNGMLLVTFEDEHKTTQDMKSEVDRDASQDSVVRQLEEELKNTRDELRSTIEQMETSNEELKASNEEVMSMNEELQSTNEELETSKEELQSLNEELTTLNSQLEDKVHELEETTNDLSNLLISTDIATLFLDREFRIRRFTPAMAPLMRLIPADIGRVVTDITWRFQDPDLLSEAAAVLARQPVEQREIQAEEQSWYLRRVLPYRTEDGHIEGVVVTFTDINRRKQVEFALRQSESHMRRITDALPVLISYIDREMRYRFNNAAYQQWFEQDLESIQGQSLLEVLGAEAFEQIRPHVQAALEGKTVDFENWVPYWRGGTRYIAAQYIPDTDDRGRVQGFFALITDLTERRRIEEQLAHLNAENQHSLDEMRALLDAAPVGIFLGRDRSCQDMVMNRAGAEMLRISDEVNPSMSGPDSQSLGFQVYHDGRELPPEELPMQVAAREGKSIKGFEEELVFADGSSINLLTYAAPLFDEKGEVRGCVGTFADVTEQKRLESALQERTQRLELADRRKDEFLAMLGHELRNPLTPIRNAVQLLELQGEQGTEIKWAAQIIDRQTRHLERMVDDLLDMARIRKGRLSIEKQPLPLQRLVQESITAMQPAIDEHQHRLSTELPEQPLIVLGDGTRLIQVFSNLLSNAVRYTPDGGQIRLTLSQTEQNQAQVEVEDNGGGISPTLLPHIFEIFNQSQSLPERSYSGLGLGLSLVKQIVRLHQGKVMAQSEGLGKGSRFIVCLPLADEQQEKTPEAESDLEQQDDSKTLDILLVDDNLDVLDSLQRLLHALGHRVRVCDSGRMVPSFVQERLPDLVLLDLGMPDMDGYQVAKALWKLPQRNEFKVVAVTGYAAEAQQIGEPTGLFDGHLLKPLTLDMLKPYV